jgi:hypothetical protein
MASFARALVHARTARLLNYRAGPDARRPEHRGDHELYLPAVEGAPDPRGEPQAAGGDREARCADGDQCVVRVHPFIHEPELL